MAHRPVENKARPARNKTCTKDFFTTAPLWHTCRALRELQTSSSPLIWKEDGCWNVSGSSFPEADLPGLIQKLIIPTDQRRSKPLQITGLSLDVRLQRVSAAVEILPRPHGLAARLRNVHWNQIFDCGSQLERGELRSAWQRHRHVHMV